MANRLLFRVSTILSCLGVLLLACEEESTNSDTQPPEVTIITPVSGEVVNEIVAIRCLATDSGLIQKVELWVDGAFTGSEDRTEPFEFSWNSISNELMYDAVISVRAIDMAGNSTDSAPVHIQVDNASAIPDEVVIQDISFSTSGYLITWSQSINTDFESYALEKSTHPSFEESQIIFSSSDITILSYTDSDIQPTQETFYRVLVTDSLGLMSYGPIASFSDSAPLAVDSVQVDYDYNTMQVSWTASEEGDFEHYTVLYGFSPDGPSDTLRVIDSIEETEFAISDFDPTIENWFWIVVSDSLQQSTMSSGAVNSIAPWVLRFDGIDDYIEIPASDDLLLGSDFVVEAWFKTENTQPQTIFEKSYADIGYNFSITQSHNSSYPCGVAVRIGNANGFSEQDLCDAEWHCVSFVYLGGGDIEMWIDGERVYWAGYGGDAEDSTQGLITFGDGDSGWFMGELRAIKLSRGSQGEIDYDPATMEFTEDEFTIALWSLNEGEGTTANDLVGTNVGNINGAQWSWVLPN